MTQADMIDSVRIFIAPVDGEFSVADFFYVFAGKEEVILIVINDEDARHIIFIRHKTYD
jgi:hypothetical protein